jgi:hypothetical protein
MGFLDMLVRMNNSSPHRIDRSDAAVFLARGVAHQLNNTLNVLILQSRALAKANNLDESHQKAVDRIARGADRISVLSQQLQAFAGRLFIDGSMKGLSEVLGNEIARRDLGQRIEAELPSGVEVWFETQFVPRLIGEFLSRLAEESDEAPIGLKWSDEPGDGALTISFQERERTDEEIREWLNPFSEEGDRGMGLAIAALAGAADQLGGGAALLGNGPTYQLQIKLLTEPPEES